MTKTYSFHFVPVDVAINTVKFIRARIRIRVRKEYYDWLEKGLSYLI